MAEQEPENKTPSRRDLPEKSDGKTAVLPSNSRFRRATQAVVPDGTGSLREAGRREIIFIVRGMVERAYLSEGDSIILGRSDYDARNRPELDLTPYGALDRGISRAHARLHLEGNRLYLTDLGSTNGTFVAGKRLTPNEPQMIRKGDEISLGRLAVQVMFE